MKQIVYLIAEKDFRDEEYFIPKGILEQAGFSVKTASSGKAGQTAIGFLGGEAVVDMPIESVKAGDYEALIIAGGPGASEYLDNEKVYSLVRKFAEDEKLVAAICVAPVVLAHAGVLKNKKATVWSSLMDRWPIKELEKFGAEFVNQDAVIDGKIITANGPDVAEKFGKAIVHFSRG